MPFAPGDAVHVPGLGKGVVREVRRERVLVEIKGRSLLVSARQLMPIGRSRARRAPAQPDEATAQMGRDHVPTSIDLHGLTPDEAMAVLDAFINDAILAGHERVQVIHGRGAGRLKDLVHRRLATIGAVRHVRLDPANAGVTIVTL